jgi:hypothetical protein
VESESTTLPSQEQLISPQIQKTGVISPSPVQRQPNEQPIEPVQQEPVQTVSDLEKEFESLMEPLPAEDTQIELDLQSQPKIKDSKGDSMVETTLVSAESPEPTRDEIINSYISIFGITYTEATAIYDAGYIKIEYLNMASPDDLGAIPNINNDTVQKIIGIRRIDNINQLPGNNPIQHNQQLEIETDIPPDEISIEDEIPGEELLNRLTSLRGRLENMESKESNSEESEEN